MEIKKKKQPNNHHGFQFYYLGFMSQPGPVTFKVKAFGFCLFAFVLPCSSKCLCVCVCVCK